MVAASRTTQGHSALLGISCGYNSELTALLQNLMPNSVCYIALVHINLDLNASHHLESAALLQ